MKKIITLFLFGISSAGFAQIGSGLVAHYEFQNNAADWSNNQAPAVLNNTSYVADRFGNPASALRFSGQSSSYADCGNNSSLQIQGDISISAWIRMESGNTHEGRIISFEDENGSSSTGYFIGTNYDVAGWHVTFGFGEWIANTSWLQAGTVIQPNTWHHVAVVGDGSTMSIYFDGVFSDGVFYTPSPNVFSNSLNLGRKSDTPNTPYQGAVDDLRIYNRAISLSDIQVLASYNPTSIPATEVKTNLISVYPNPVKNTVRMDTDIDADEPVEVTMYDITGKPVKAAFSMFNGRKGISVQFDMETLNSGVYFVSLTARTGKITARIVKE